MLRIVLFFIAVAFIVLGFIAAVADDDLLLNSIGWFIAAIAVNTLPAVSFGRTKA